MMYLEDLDLTEDTFINIDASMYSPRSNHALPTSPTPEKPTLSSRESSTWANTGSELPPVEQNETPVCFTVGTGLVPATVPNTTELNEDAKPRKRGRPKKIKQEIIKSAGGSNQASRAKQEDEQKRKAEERRERRRESNRRAARKCRDRKKSEAELQNKERLDYITENTQLKEENKSLKAEVVRLKDEIATYEVKQEVPYGNIPGTTLPGNMLSDPPMLTTLPSNSSFHTFNTSPPPCSNYSSDPFTSPSLTPLFHDVSTHASLIPPHTAPTPVFPPHTVPSPAPLLPPHTVPTLDPIAPLFTVAPSTPMPIVEVLHLQNFPGQSVSHLPNEPMPQQGVSLLGEPQDLIQQQGVPVMGPPQEQIQEILDCNLPEVISLADVQSLDIQSLLLDL